MKLHLFNSGAIACSAILLYNWAQATAAEPDCSMGDEDQQMLAESVRCLLPLRLASLTNAPEQLLPIEWGQRQSIDLALPSDMEAIYDQRLEQAQAAANREQFTVAINQVAGIPQNSRHYELAQRLQLDWSREVVRRAAEQWQQAQFEPALALLATIPPQPELAEPVRKLQTQWRQQSEIWERAIVAKQRGDWQGVITALKALEETPPYQSLPVQELLQQALTQMYEPDQKLLTIAMADLPAVNTGIADPEAIATLN
jgi:hypothetical protein